jgi:DNA-binding HxlR family transcriptional regulator
MTNVYPLYVTITQILSKGALTDIKLFNQLKEEYDDLNMRDLTKDLIKLEIEGIIHVSTLSKERRRVELTN